MQYPTSSKYKKKQEVNTIVHHEVDDIILQQDENKKLIEKLEPQQFDNTGSVIYEKDMYELDKLSLFENK